VSEHRITNSDSKVTVGRKYVRNAAWDTLGIHDLLSDENLDNAIFCPEYFE
jgi:hypothetical protein